MSTKLWQRGETLGVDPNAVTDLEFDATMWLRGDEIASASVQATACDAVLQGREGNIAKFRVTNVESGAKVTLTIATVSGRSRPWSWNFNPVPQ